jgi:glucokinase
MPKVLVADIGGTHCRLALARAGAARPSIEQLGIQLTPRGSMEATLRGYLRQTGVEAPAAIAIAAAGKVRRTAARSWIALTNTALRIEREALQEAFGVPVFLANDLAGVAAALPLLGVDERQPFGPRRPPNEGLRLVIGVGTGFGVAALTADGSLIETEAGHADLPAVAAEERECLNRLAPLGRASIEQLFSGAGLLRLYELIGGPSCDSEAQVLFRARQDEPAACKTMAVFSTWLGRIAGNLVLQFGAWSGVYLTGGVLTHAGSLLDPTAFRRGFEDKAPFSADLAAVSVDLILHPQPALLGMAGLALAEMPPSGAQ